MTTRRVIVADDTDDMRVLFEAVLEPNFDIAEVATTGREALEQWRARGGPVLAVVLDQRMPDIEGIEVAKEVLRDDPDQRVVLISAQLSEALRDEAEAIGVAAVLDKQDMFALVDVIEAWAD